MNPPRSRPISCCERPLDPRLPRSSSTGEANSRFDQLPAILLMIVGTIVAGSVGRVVYQIALTVTGGDNGFVTMFLNLVPALTALISLILSHVDRRPAFCHRPDVLSRFGGHRSGADFVFAQILEATRSTKLSRRMPPPVTPRSCRTSASPAS